MTHRPNRNHLPPERSRRELEDQVRRLETEVDFLRDVVASLLCPGCSGNGAEHWREKIRESGGEPGD
jgi:hypothetical protein